MLTTGSNHNNNANLVGEIMLNNLIFNKILDKICIELFVKVVKLCFARINT